MAAVCDDSNKVHIPAVLILKICIVISFKLPFPLIGTELLYLFRKKYLIVACFFLLELCIL
jgi:hypothetical protein